MLTKEGCEARQRRLWERVPPQVEWLLIADPRHVLYLSNFWVNPLSFSCGERGLLLLERDHAATILADNMTIRSAAKPVLDLEVIEEWYDHKHSVENRDHMLVKALKHLSGRLAKKTGLVETEWLPLEACASLPMENVRNRVPGGDEFSLGTHLRELRRIKEPDEIALLRECMHATDAGHARAWDVVRAGASELDVYREVQSAAIAAAGRPGLVYGDFRATTAKTPKVGGLPTEYRLQTGDLFILDYSVVLEGYRSDFTNTLAVGTPTKEQQKTFEVCLAAMHAGEGTLKAGARAADVYAAVSQQFVQAGLPPLPHHAGHGIGLAHPEPPILVPESTDILVAGDVVTLEPGAYLPGIGGMRIENNYLITETGAERLSNHRIALS
jgi:Xaa-Pro aminopeptidase